jgi:hypothetical protein
LASSHYHPRTGELVVDPPQVRITVKGLGVLHRKLGGTSALAIEAPDLLTTSGRAGAAAARDSAPYPLAEGSTG